MQRRRFLTILGAAGVVLALPEPLVSARTYFIGGWPGPHLWGDGIHDDGPAIQEIINQGKQLPTGLYAVSTPFHLPPGTTFSGNYSTLIKRMPGPMIYMPFPGEEPAEIGMLMVDPPGGVIVKELDIVFTEPYKDGPAFSFQDLYLDGDY